MRLEIELIEGGGASPAAELPRLPISSRRRLDWFDLSLLAAFGLLSLCVVALDLWQVIVNGRVWTGTDGVYIVDQMQYVAWIQEASHHLLASNLFVLRPTPADYFQPAVAISGGLTALGMAPWLALLLWKPVAVGAFFFGVRAYVNRSLIGRWPRRAALVLALFFGSFTVVYGSFSVLGDLFPGFLSWGYVFGLLALAAMVWALVAFERARASGRRQWVPGLLGALAALLHPWNAELLIALIVIAEVVMLTTRRYRPEQLRSSAIVWDPSTAVPSRRLPATRRRRLPAIGRWPAIGRLRLPPVAELRLAAITLVITAIPLLYYAILGKADLSWKLAQQASKHSFSFWSITLAVAPLLLLSIPAYRKRPTTFLAAATRAWPVAAFAIFVLSGTSIGATPLHAFQGITIPLSVLAVEGVQLLGWRRLRRPILIGSLAVAAFTLPATAYEIKIAHDLAAPTPDNANFITRDERSALTYLASNREAGSVLTRSYLGAVVPGTTGRHTYVGDCLWSEPGCYTMTDDAQNLFDGSLTPAAARSFVVSTGARFVLADCETTADMRKLLGPVIRSAHPFGCAAVYEVE